MSQPHDPNRQPNNGADNPHSGGDQYGGNQHGESQYGGHAQSGNEYGREHFSGNQYGQSRQGGEAYGGGGYPQPGSGQPTSGEYGQQAPGYGSAPGAQPQYGQAGQQHAQQVPYQGYPQSQQKKPWYKRPIIVVPLILLALFILALGSCIAFIGTAANEVDKQMSAEHKISYAVEGDAKDASVTYSAGQSNTSQDTGVAAGWTKEVTITGPLGATSTATNGMNDTGAVTCKILKDGNVISENTATGAFATATCSATDASLNK
ncbi:MmpS family transport accessory protein [Corynebacterium heidelbergense]|uniref:MmpS family membrane protein n=1 Tax=Corynebacterium heidelbergense TaxID=2055947 RepID=A0A364V8Q8_9CORY|nr:MmpS family transport accessory protein [Corynebacterium heidelbergense]RAV33042.1 hypothetical protein CWC39_10020 [Corynebacterium heidelbergense]WCZ36857.1 hypothetical protein CHEID_06615 [Corynebacterium heidelbergense]